MNLKTLPSFARSLITGDRPVYAHFALTDRCDMQCRACSIWRRKNAYDELPLPEIQALAGVLRSIGCIQVSLGGGEPALRDDLPDILRAFLRAGLRTRVLTNGVAMTPKVADRLIDANMTEVSFSLDALDPAVLERFDNRPDSAEIKMTNLLHLAGRLPKRGALPLINTVVASPNLDELPKLVDLAQKIGFFISFIPVHLAAKNETGHSFFGQDESLRIDSASQDKLQKVYTWLIKRKRRGAPIVNSTAFLQRSAIYLSEGKVDWPCRAGILYVSVRPDGGISPCHAWEEKWAIPFREFPAALRSADYRSRLRSKLNGCRDCFRPCWAEISFMMTQAASLAEQFRIQAKIRKRRPEFDAQMVRCAWAQPGENDR